MTPLATWLARWVLRPLVLPALAMLYAVMMLGLVLVVGTGEIDNVYVDVGAQ